MATPLGYFNGIPYYTVEEYSRLLAADRGRSAGTGNPGVWGTAGAGGTPQAPSAPSAPKTSTSSGTYGITPFDFSSPQGGGESAPGGYSVPNYSDLLAMVQGSPFWQQLEQQRQAADAAELAGLQSQARQQYAQFGEAFDMPAGWSKYNLLDAQSKALAEQNTKSGLSTIARLRENRDDTIQALVRRLNARGLRRSGSKLFGMNRAQLGYDRNSTDARNQLLASIANQIGAYGNNAYSRLMGNQSQMQNLMGMYSANYAPNYSGVNTTSKSGFDPLAPPDQKAWNTWIADRAKNGTGGFL